MVEERDKLAPALEQAKWGSRQLEKRLEEAGAAAREADKVRAAASCCGLPAPCTTTFQMQFRFLLHGCRAMRPARCLLLIDAWLLHGVCHCWICTCQVVSHGDTVHPHSPSNRPS